MNTETTQNNKLIAEFMGFEMTHKINYVPSKYPNCMKNAEHLKVDNPDNLPFHSSWDWLMPVVRKITSLEEFDDYDPVNHANTQLAEALLTDDIVRAHNEVVDFIKWYNQQK